VLRTRAHCVAQRACSLQMQRIWTISLHLIWRVCQFRNILVCKPSQVKRDNPENHVNHRSMVHYVCIIDSVLNESAKSSVTVPLVYGISLKFCQWLTRNQAKHRSWRPIHKSSLDNRSSTEVHHDNTSYLKGFIPAVRLTVMFSASVGGDYTLASNKNYPSGI
jgi:hypothetical protein